MKRSREKQEQRRRRAARTRSRIHGTSEIPRLSVFRSARHIYAQLIDDTARRTLAYASDRDLPGRRSRSKQAPTPVAGARAVGQVIAERAQKLGIRAVVFDRGRYAYHGAVRALAEGARQGGLKF